MNNTTIGLVPTALRNAQRIVIMNNPRSISGELHSRVVKRTYAAEAGQMGGLPTMGGIGVMDAEEEAEVDYVPLGPVKVLFTTAYEPTTLNDAADAPESMPVSEAIIEPMEAGAFLIRDGDLVMLMPGGGVVVPYEVTKVLNLVSVPPYVGRYELSAHGNIMFDSDLATPGA